MLTSLHNLWSNDLLVKVQVYQTKDHRFKIIRRLKNCLSFHPSKVNLWISSILLVCIKNTNLISQNVLQMYFFCQNNIDLKYTSSSVIQQVEVYFKHTWSILEVCLKYTSNIIWKYTSSIFEVYIKYNLVASLCEYDGKSMENWDNNMISELSQCRESHCKTNTSIRRK